MHEALLVLLPPVVVVAVYLTLRAAGRQSKLDVGHGINCECEECYFEREAIKTW